MLHLRPLSIGLLALASFTVTTAMADPTAGKLVFERRCAECHAPGFGHPGTQQLGWTRGEGRAVLERRSDLTAAYIDFVVRNGLMEMPAFRPTEITDAELQQLADYLARSKP
jgi:mono/diheme cytochrome c family protein